MCDQMRVTETQYFLLTTTCIFLVVVGGNVRKYSIKLTTRYAQESGTKDKFNITLEGAEGQYNFTVDSLHENITKSFDASIGDVTSCLQFYYPPEDAFTLKVKYMLVQTHNGKIIVDKWTKSIQDELWIKPGNASITNSSKYCREHCPQSYELKAHYCHKCKKDFYQGIKDTVEPCLECSYGKRSNPGAFNCFDVTCNPGERINNHDCSACLSNYFSPGQRTFNCTKCFSYQYSNPKSSICTNTTCVGGFAAQNHTCETCPANYFSSGGNAVECTECKSQQYSNAGDNDCTNLECDSGKIPNQHICEQCPKNTYVPRGKTICLPCEDGQISQPGSISCLNTCKNFPEEWSQIVPLNKTLVENDSIALSCMTNYSLKGSKRVTCKSEGNFTYTELPTCIPQCLDIPEIDDIDLDHIAGILPLEYGDTTSIKCLDNFRSEGNLTCKENGKFESTTVRCVQIVEKDLEVEEKVKNTIHWGLAVGLLVGLLTIASVFIAIIYLKRQDIKRICNLTS